jgi:hypothetical protein
MCNEWGSYDVNGVDDAGLVNSQTFDVKLIPYTFSSGRDKIQRSFSKKYKRLPMQATSVLMCWLPHGNGTEIEASKAIVSCQKFERVGKVEDEAVDRAPSTKIFRMFRIPESTPSPFCFHQTPYSTLHNEGDRGERCLLLVHFLLYLCFPVRAYDKCSCT